MTGILVPIAGSNTLGNIFLSYAYITSTGSGANQSAVFRLSPDGFAYRVTTQSGTAPLFQWLPSSFAASDYQVYITAFELGSLTPNSGTDTWLSLGSVRNWGIVDSLSSYGPTTQALSVQIRDIATQTVQATTTIDLNAQRT